MHAEECPICEGKGKTTGPSCIDMALFIDKLSQTAGTITSPQGLIKLVEAVFDDCPVKIISKDCHGCEGRGWVEVGDGGRNWRDALRGAVCIDLNGIVSHSEPCSSDGYCDICRPESKGGR